MEKADITLPSYNADRIWSALKQPRRLDKLDWGTDARGDDALLVRMPGNSVNLILSRNDTGHYRLYVNRLAVTDVALANRVEGWLGDYRLEHAPNGHYDEAQLKRAFEATRQHYRTLHKPQHLQLPKERDKPLASRVAEEDSVYSYNDLMTFLKEGSPRLKWGPRPGHEGETILLEMPDPSTSLIIRRDHRKQGTVYEAFAANLAGAQPELVQATQQHIDSFTARRETRIIQQHGMLADDLRDLVYGVRRFTCNEVLSPTVPVQHTKGRA